MKTSEDLREDLPACSRLQSGPSQEGILDALHRCEALEARTQQLLALVDALTARLDALEAKRWTSSEVFQANQNHG